MKMKIICHNPENPEIAKDDEYEIKLTNEEWYELLRTVNNSFYSKLKKAEQQAEIKWVNN